MPFRKRIQVAKKHIIRYNKAAKQTSTDLWQHGRTVRLYEVAPDTASHTTFILLLETMIEAMFSGDFNSEKK